MTETDLYTPVCAMCGCERPLVYPVLPRGLASQVPYCGNARKKAENFCSKPGHRDRRYPNQIRLCEECNARLRVTYLFAERMFYPEYVAHHPEAKPVPQPEPAPPPELEVTSAEVVYLDSPNIRFRRRG